MLLNELSVHDIEQLEKLKRIDFIVSDNETERLMNKVLAQSVVFLNLLEKEKFLFDHYNYLMLNIEQRNHQQHLANIETSIREAMQELANIDRRETCEKPFWVKSEKIIPQKETSYNEETGGYSTTYRYQENFSYDGKAPISRIELDAGHHFDYFKSWWDPELSRDRDFIKGGAINLLRIFSAPLSLGLSELIILGHTAGLNRCRFARISLQGEPILLSFNEEYFSCSKYWVKDIDLPEQTEEKHSQFHAEYKGFGWYMSDCYYREPKVTIYTRICDMHGNPERIVGLNDLIALLQEQKRETQEIMQQSLNIQGQLELIRSNLESCHDEIQQLRELMFVIAKVCMPSQAFIHENIKKFLQFWQQRENRNANALTFEVSNQELSEFKGFFKKNCSTLFRDGQHSFVVQRTTPEELTIKTYYPRVVEDNSNMLFQRTRHSFARFISARPGYRQFTKNEQDIKKCVYFEIRELENHITSYLVDGRSINIERSDLTITDEEWRALKGRIRNRECHGLEILMEAAARKGLIPEKKEEVWALQGDPGCITQAEREIALALEETGSTSCIMS